MDNKDNDLESLEKFAASQVLKIVAEAYVKAIYLHLPNKLLLKFVSEAYCWFLHSLEVSTETGIKAIEDAAPRVTGRIKETEAKMQQDISKMLTKLDKESGMSFPELDKKKEPGVN